MFYVEHMEVLTFELVLKAKLLKTRTLLAFTLEISINRIESFFLTEDAMLFA